MTCSHDGPRWHDRCVRCTHRCPVNGVPPRSSRSLTVTRPWYPLIELLGRARARHARRFYAAQR